MINQYCSLTLSLLVELCLVFIKYFLYSLDKWIMPPRYLGTRFHHTYCLIGYRIQKRPGLKLATIHNFIFQFCIFFCLVIFKIKIYLSVIGFECLSQNVKTILILVQVLIYYFIRFWKFFILLQIKNLVGWSSNVN